MDNNNENKWSAREQLERQLEIQFKGKTPEQIVQESFERTRALIQAEKEAQQKESSDRIGALRAIFNACNPKPSEKFKR